LTECYPYDKVIATKPLEIIQGEELCPKRRREVKKEDGKGRREELKLIEDRELREEKKKKKLKRKHDQERIDAQGRNGGGSSKEGREKIEEQCLLCSTYSCELLIRWFLTA
jgi:hypothetical protein